MGVVTSQDVIDAAGMPLPLQRINPQLAYLLYVTQHTRVSIQHRLLSGHQPITQGLLTLLHLHQPKHTYINHQLPTS